jgi:hypothetical protein
MHALGIIFPGTGAVRREVTTGASGPAITGPTAFFRMEEATSANRADSAGGLTLTNNGAVAQASGRLGNAASFPTSSDYLEELTGTGISGSRPAGGIEVGLWFYLTDIGSFAHTLFSGSGGPTLRVDTNGKLNWIAGNNAIHGTVLSTSTWYAVSVTLDGSQSQVMLNNGAATTGTTMNTFNTPLFVGINSGLAQALSGRVDAMGIWWGTVLSSSERTAWYNGGAGVEYYSSAWH